ncbi:MAG: hypothetical protein R3B93_00390 [Bacteroidia bacterium]
MQPQANQPQGASSNTTAFSHSNNFSTVFRQRKVIHTVFMVNPCLRKSKNRVDLFDNSEGIPSSANSLIKGVKRSEKPRESRVKQVLRLRPYSEPEFRQRSENGTPHLYIFVK